MTLRGLSQLSAAVQSWHGFQGQEHHRDEQGELVVGTEVLGVNPTITACNGGTAKGVWWALTSKPGQVMGNGNFMVILFFSPFLMSLPLPSTAGRSRQERGGCR